MVKDFSESAKEALRRAEQAARSMNHDFIGTEHILLGLIADESGACYGALKRLGVTPAQVRTEIESFVRRGPNVPAIPTLPYTPRASKAIEQTGREAALLQQALVGPEHLFVGLTLQPEGVAAKALLNLGLDLRQVRRAAIRIRLGQFKIVERVVRPVAVAVTYKRKMREEMLAHLTHLYEEELSQTHDPDTAMRQAALRFGEPAQLANQLKSSVTMGRRIGYAMERFYGWRAPESAERFCLRVARQLFVIMAAAIGVGVLGMILRDVGPASIWIVMRPAIALLIFLPASQFVLGVLYFRMRDALHGAFGKRRSASFAATMALLIIAATTTMILGYIVLANWNPSQAAAALAPSVAVAFGVGIFYFLMAGLRGPVEISDTIWACLDLETSEF
jgi:hypothetical protein